jgi:hypothetical protein
VADAQRPDEDTWRWPVGAIGVRARVRFGPTSWRPDRGSPATANGSAPCRGRCIRLADMAYRSGFIRTVQPHVLGRRPTAALHVASRITRRSLSAAAGWDKLRAPRIRDAREDQTDLCNCALASGPLCMHLLATCTKLYMHGGMSYHGRTYVHAQSVGWPSLTLSPTTQANPSVLVRAYMVHQKSGSRCDQK